MVRQDLGLPALSYVISHLTIAHVFNTRVITRGEMKLTLNDRLSNQDKDFLRLAAKVAEHSDCSIRHGAVLVKNGRVLALGHNKKRNSSTCNDTKDYTVHAERDCLSHAKHTKGATLYITRINNGKAIRFSAPCAHCLQLLVKSGVKRVIFT